MYLQPVFDSADISKQLPMENKWFRNVDSTWKNLITQGRQNPNIMDYSSQQGLLDKLVDMFNTLEKVQKGLEEYLKLKRRDFPRF